MLIVDLTMPRNVDPTLDGLTPNLAVADLQDLRDWDGRETVDMQGALDLSRQIVDEHRDIYEKLVGRLLPVR